MIRSGFVFLGTFIVGAVIALLARASMFDPQPNHTGHPPAGGDYAAMVSNSLAPASTAPLATVTSPFARLAPAISSVPIETVVVPL